MMAGRNISASHVAFSSTRVMSTCAVMGQAAGTAAALCARAALTPRQLAQDKARLAELQHLLLRDDQTIVGALNTDPNDLARQAAVSASGALPGAGAKHVLDGCVRDLPDQTEHVWAAKMSEAGAWIELTWPAPQKLRQVQITFDTGFQRLLRLTAQASYDKKIIRGPQPETVRDYELLCTDAAGQTRPLAKVTGNYQRLTRHKFTPVEAKSLRLRITATNGADTARVFEIRCYA